MLYTRPTREAKQKFKPLIAHDVLRTVDKEIVNFVRSSFLRKTSERGGETHAKHCLFGKLFEDLPIAASSTAILAQEDLA